MMRISNDTLARKIEISVFQPDIPMQIKDNNISDYGKISIANSRKPDSLRIISSSVKILEKEIIKDSTLIWFDIQEPFDSIQLVLKSEDKTDTLNIKQRKNLRNQLSLMSELLREL